MYQLYRLFDGDWIEFDKPTNQPSRRQAMRYFRQRYNYREGTFKVRKVS